MRGIWTYVLAAVCLLLSCPVRAGMPVAQYRDLPSLKEQDALEKKWVQKRYQRIPEIMKKHGYDAWILSMREYAEDTVFRALVSSTTTFSARRRTLFLFHTSTNMPNPLYLVDNKPGIWDDVNNALDELQPAKIAVNIDEDMAFSDGLHSGEGRLLLSKLHRKWRHRVSSCRALGVETIAARVGGQEQLDMCRLMMENVWAMIQEGFSEKVIEVGKTTAEDLEWFFRDVMRWKIGTGTWFPPAVDIYRSPSEPSVAEHPAMREGDLLHVDIGITAMGMNTDTQHLAYILRSNETEAPADLVRGLHNSNRMQDLNRKEMVPGRTGDDVFFRIKDDMRSVGLDGDIYSHPIGDYGHSAGAVIGMANWQNAIPGGGQNKVLEDYWTSVELAGRTFVSDWGVAQRFELEEDVYWDPETRTFEWVFGQQTELHLIYPRKGHYVGWHLLSWLQDLVNFDLVRWA